MLDYDTVVVILGLILEVVIIFGLPVLVAMLVAAVFIKIFARTLSFGRACLIALRSFAVATVLLTIYYIVKIIFLLPWTFDVPAIVLWLALAGRSTTRRLAKYGIEKTERFGVGARIAASLFALICVAVGVNQFLPK
jgi:hypothetical protein